MNYLNAIRDSAHEFLALWWLSLLFAAVPPGALAIALAAKNKRWLVVFENGTERKVRYGILGLAGGLAGGFTAVFSLVLGMAWFCYKQYAVCHDGQAGFALIFTIPMLSMFGSGLSLLWTRWTLQGARNRLWASIFCYSGQWPGLNFIGAIVIQLVYWAIFTYCIFWLTINGLV
jgi:hypothetical protein